MLANVRMLRLLASPLAFAAMVASCLVASTALVACGDATDHVASGGELQLAATVPASPGAVLHCAPDGGATWTDLYRDCFSPEHAGCGGTSDCHADATHGGGAIWTCGATAESCFVGIKTLVLTDPSHVDESELLVRLRKAPGDPSLMPLGTSFVFAPDDVARIRKWIADGAKEN
jgi:hypothetical protein